jgi:hypothetical protein
MPIIVRDGTVTPLKDSKGWGRADFSKKTPRLSLMTTYRMSPISTGSSTFKLLKDRGPIRVYTEETFEASLTHRQSYSPTLHSLLSQLLSAVTHIEPDNDNLGVFFSDVTTLALNTLPID